MLRSGFRLGRIFGINIYIDWSWLLIFLLVTWSLAAGPFAQLHPDWGLYLRWGTAIVAAVLFFGSVLAHELAHSIVAKSRGIPVRNITLFLFGGVSNIQREPPSAGVEFFMAIVGPLTSIVLGIIFLLLGAATAGAFGVPTIGTFSFLARLSPVSTLLLWLGPVNIVLGLFNLIPGFPLDGGRVLRSILWAIMNNLRRATQIASWVGQIVAWLFILVGIAMAFGVSIPFFGTGFISGLWLAFIGWFLNTAAQQSYRQVVVEDILQGVPVEQLMTSHPPSVSPDTLVGELVHKYIMGTDERAFPVVEGDCLAGLVCLEDVRKVPRERWETTTVREIMTPADKLTVASPREDATDAFNDLARTDVRQVPVVQDCHVVGMLRRRDIVRWLQLHSAVAAE